MDFLNKLIDRYNSITPKKWKRVGLFCVIACGHLSGIAAFSHSNEGVIILAVLGIMGDFLTGLKVEKKEINKNEISNKKI